MPAGSVTTDELLAQIAALQAQLASMGGGGGTAPAITMPSPTVNVCVGGAAKSILPGAQKVSVVDVYIAATRPYAQPTDMVFVSNNADMCWNYQLWADMNTKTNDGVNGNGCETPVAWAQSDSVTGAVNFQINQKVWVMQKSTHFAVTADFSTYLQADSFCFDLAWANFRGPDGKAVPDTKINYAGTAPTHTLCSAMLSMQESQMLPAQSVTAGQKGAELFNFDAWTNHAQPTSLSLVAANGKLTYASNYKLLVDADYDGNYEKTFVGSVVNSALTFRFTTADFGGFYSGKFTVVGDIASTNAGQHLQLGFPANGKGITGIDSDTGRSLVGTAINGGAGQVRLNLNQPSRATMVTIVNPQPVLAVKEFGAPPEQRYQEVTPGQTDVVLDAFTAYAKEGHNITVNTVAIAASEGDFSLFTHYVLWWDSDSDGVVDASTTAKPRQDGRQMYFENLAIAVGAGQTVCVEVHADVPQDASDVTSAYGCLRVGISQDGIKAQENAVDLAIRDMFIGHEWQVFHYLQGGGGLG